MPRAEWDLPSASAAQLPLAHELPWARVSKLLVEKEAGSSSGGPRSGGRFISGAQEAWDLEYRWSKESSDIHSQHFPGDFLGEAYHHSPARFSHS